MAEPEPELVEVAEPEPSRSWWKWPSRAEPELVEVADAEPESEPVSEVEPDVATEAASLFDRLRAEREAEVLAAEAVLRSAAADDATADSDAGPVTDAVGGPADTSTSTQDLLAARTAAIEAVVPMMAKQAKRALSDLQNEFLASLRTGSTITVDTEALESALTGPLPTAWAAGATAIGRPGTTADAQVGRVADALQTEVFGRLRHDLERAAELGDDAVEGVRRVVRKLRPRLSHLAESAAAAAFLDGVLDTVPDGCPVRWVAGDGLADAKHAATNGSVEIRLGAPFPTGEVRPAPLGDCRCLVVPLHI